MEFNKTQVYPMSNSNIAVVYFSGYGHTKVVAETFANEINAQLIQIDQEGNITEQDWETLNNAKGIVFGAPTYMGTAPWQFKKFAELQKFGLHVVGKIKYLQALPIVQV